MQRYVLGGFDTHEILLRELDNGSQAAIVFVNYTHSPEAKHPIALEVAYADTKWVAENGQTHHQKKHLFLRILQASFTLYYRSQVTIATKRMTNTEVKANYCQLPSQSPPCLQNALTPSPNILPATGATIMAELGGSFNCSIMYDTIDMPVALFSVSTFL
ncbi:MAG: alpha/beta hydrolase fold domain-containing protein [Candidatus Nitrosocosmicus sp.]